MTALPWPPCFCSDQGFQAALGICGALHKQVAFQIPRNVSELFKAPFSHLILQLFFEVFFGQLVVYPTFIPS